MAQKSVQWAGFSEVVIQVLSPIVLNTTNTQFRNLSQLNPFSSIIEKLNFIRQILPN